MKVLVVGYGSIGKRHAEIISKGFTEFEITLVTKQKVDKARTFYSLEKVPELNDYDYYVISTETSKHFMTLEYLNKELRGKKILVEKPLFSKHEEFSVRNKVFVGYNLRFNPVLQELKKIIGADHVLSVNIQTGQYLPTWRSDRDYRLSYSAKKSEGGGVLLDLSHEIDYASWLFGKLKILYAYNSRISDLEIDSDDYASIFCMTEKNTLVNLTIDYFSKIPIRNIHVNLNESSINACLITNKIVKKDASGKISEIEFKDIACNLSYFEMHKNILSGKFDDVCSFEDGLEVMKTIDEVRMLNGFKRQ